MAHPIVFFEVTCRDAAPVASFYSDVFGWKVAQAGEVHSVETGGGIDGMISEIPDDVPSALTVYVRVDDLDAAIADVTAHGGALLFPAMNLPNGERVAMITDPAGTAIGLLEHRA